MTSFDPRQPEPTSPEPAQRRIGDGLTSSLQAALPKR